MVPRRLGLFMTVMIALSAIPHQAHGRTKKCSDLVITDRPHILPEDLESFQAIANKYQLEISVMAPNPASLRFRYRSGFAAKPKELERCKTADEGPVEGLVHCPEQKFRTRREWLQYRTYLLTLGYEILGPEHHYLVRRISDRKLFFSDHDLFSVRRLSDLAPAYSEQLRAELNQLFGRNLVRHPPLADYERRLEVSIKIPLIIVTAHQPVVVIETRDDLEREFRARGLPRW